MVNIYYHLKIQHAVDTKPKTFHDCDKILRHKMEF